MDAKAVIAGSAKSKMQWAAALMIALGLIVDNPQMFGQLVPDEYLGKLLAGFGLLNMWLRAITSTSLAEKAAPKEGGFVSVKMLLVLACVSGGLLLGSCAAPPKRVDVPVVQTLPPALQEAQRLVHEANVLIAAAAITIGQNTAAGISTGAEGSAQLDKLDAHRAEVKRVQALIDAGDVLNSANRARLINGLVSALHKEVADRARKAKP